MVGNNPMFNIQAKLLDMYSSSLNADASLLQSCLKFAEKTQIPGHCINLSKQNSYETSYFKCFNVLVSNLLRLNLKKESYLWWHRPHWLIDSNLWLTYNIIPIFFNRLAQII